MVDTTLSTMDAVAALMQEREKYEGWLATLDSRRATTPPRVYERVGADYRGRLDQVLAEIAGRASELEAVSDGLRTRVQALQADDDLRAEERAESEVRAAVGEYSAEQWEELRSVADAEIEHVSAQLAEQRAELARVEGILAIAQRPRTEPDRGAADRGEIATGGVPNPELARWPADATPVASAGPPRADRASTPDSSVIVPFTVESEAAARPREPEGAPRSPPAEQQWSDGGANDSAFDDLAFLKSIVEPTAPTTASPAPSPSTSPASSSTRPIPRGEESRLSTPGRGLAALRSLLGADEKGGAAPRSAQGAGGRDEQRASAAGRDEGGSGAAKTLRCGECGTLNYPTEWYCERCGGELAAM